MLRFLIFAFATFATSCIAASREFPLAEVFSTVRQEGLQYVSSGRRIVDKKMVEEDYVAAMDALVRDRTGASNTVIVAAGNISDAIKATQLVFDGFRTAEKPVLPIGIESDNCWLAVYLGCGHSEPRKWIVESVTVTGNAIRLTYKKPKAGLQTGDVVRYYHWAPIGALDDGAYSLELFDADLKAVTLMRRVEVKRH